MLYVLPRSITLSGGLHATRNTASYRSQRPSRRHGLRHDARTALRVYLHRPVVWTRSAAVAAAVTNWPAPRTRNSPRASGGRRRVRVRRVVVHVSDLSRLLDAGADGAGRGGRRHHALGSRRSRFPCGRDAHRYALIGNGQRAGVERFASACGRRRSWRWRYGRRSSHVRDPRRVGRRG